MRYGRQTVLAVAVTMAIVICGCGKKGPEDKQPSAPGQSSPSQSAQQATPAPQAPTGGTVPSATEMTAMAEKNRETLTQLNQGKQIAAVTADTLKGLLPETLASMKRTDASAERNQTMGVDMTIAESQYQGEDDTSIDLTITDIGNMTGAMRMGMTAWTLAQYDRQKDSGYEKTTTFGSFKGVEEFENEGQHGTIRVFVADRFVVELNGDGIPMDTLKKALDQIDLKKMAALASGS